MRQMITTRSKAVANIVAEAERTRKAAQRKTPSIQDNWNFLKQKGFGYCKESRPVAMFDYDKGRMLYDVLPDGTWRGQRCFIIGGGESLKDFDFSKLKNEMVIGVNRAYEKMDCMVNFAMDNDLYGWITNGKLGAEAKKKFEDYKGYPVWLDSIGYNYPQGIFILNKSESRNLGNNMKDGIMGGTNSGFGALNLAVYLGANPIYLLGFDMKGKDGKQVNWHNEYPEKQGEKVYKAFINDFNRVAPELKKRKIQVVNLNDESELKCFEFGRFEDIKKIDRPVIASYYTKDSDYEKQVKELIISLRRLNLEYDIKAIEDRGGWHKNTYWKSTFVLNTLKKHRGRSVVFVDADAIFRQSPILFNDYNCDFAYHYYNNKELLGGTLYFGNTNGARYVAEQWVEIDKEKMTTHMPQKNLQALFGRIQHKVKWKHMPIEYCMIFDCHQRRHGKLHPVIEHFQLSRKNKDQHYKSSKYKLKSGLSQIQKLCKGKRMCILGNADSMMNHMRGKEIDSFEIIGRMNRGKPQGIEKFIGKRTDILFLSTGLSRKSIEVAYEKAKFVVWMTEDHHLAHDWVLRNAIQNPIKDWRALHKRLGKNPTTGMMTLKFVLKYLDFKSLTIYGYNFLRTKSWYNTKPDKGIKHSGKKEEPLFMEMIKDRKNVKFMK